ncbi:DNA repair protein rad2, partial [Cladochytrium tenue]
MLFDFARTGGVQTSANPDLARRVEQRDRMREQQRNAVQRIASVKGRDYVLVKDEGQATVGHTLRILQGASGKIVDRGKILDDSPEAPKAPKPVPMQDSGSDSDEDVVFEEVVAAPDVLASAIAAEGGLSDDDVALFSDDESTNANPATRRNAPRGKGQNEDPTARTPGNELRLDLWYPHSSAKQSRLPSPTRVPQEKSPITVPSSPTIGAAGPAEDLNIGPSLDTVLEVSSDGENESISGLRQAGSPDMVLSEPDAPEAAIDATEDFSERLAMRLSLVPPGASKLFPAFSLESAISLMDKDLRTLLDERDALARRFMKMPAAASDEENDSLKSCHTAVELIYTELIARQLAAERGDDGGEGQPGPAPSLRLHTEDRVPESADSNVVSGSNSNGTLYSSAQDEDRGRTRLRQASEELPSVESELKRMSSLSAVRVEAHPSKTVGEATAPFEMFEDAVVASSKRSPALPSTSGRAPTPEPLAMEFRASSASLNVVTPPPTAQPFAPETDTVSPPVASADTSQEMTLDDLVGVAAQAPEEAEEFERFLGELRSKGSAQVSLQLHNEIALLKDAHRAGRRDADGITDDMIRDIQDFLRMFGLPYMTAPQEAEAQCAWLLEEGLVDGIVTDDSDVFLFGGAAVYKNMFNARKFVEAYSFDRLRRSMGLTRHALVFLAYLLGSDYTPGVAGVGAVSAMEILGEFFGRRRASAAADGENAEAAVGDGDDNDDGDALEALSRFAEWVRSVQLGIDRPEDGLVSPAFSHNYRKRAQTMDLPDAFPDPRVLEAYLRPEVDENRLRFEWGSVDLAAVRAFMEDRVGYPPDRTAEVLVPVLSERDRRRKDGQARIEPFFALAARPTQAVAVHPNARIQRAADGLRNGVRPAATTLSLAPR